MLKKRIATAVFLLPLVGVVVWFDEPLPWLAIFAAIWGVMAALEFYKAVTASEQKVPPLTIFGLVWTLFFIISPLFDYPYLNIILLASALALPAIWFLLRRYREGAFTGWAWTVTGILYVGWLLSHLVALRGLESGRDWVLFALFITFAGILGAIGGGLLLVMLLDLPVTYIQVIPLSIAVSIFGQFGDLLESLFKRRTGVKDSGKAMPGHGGFLDRMDSVVFAGVFVYYYVAILYNDWLFS